jgi:CubicO group peptidase (beta-lactamase class C family)
MGVKTVTRIVIAVLAVIVASTLALQDTLAKAHPLQASTAITSDEAQQMQRIEGTQTPYRQGLDAFTLQQVMEKFHVPGLSIAVIKDFKIQWAKGYGVADVKSGRPVNVDTLFQAASISKPVTAMAALRLVQEGRFSLDEDVNHILKTWHIPDRTFTREQPVTPRSLFSHTSGADDGFGFPGYDPGAARPTVVQILNGQPPSNTGPVLFARRPYQGYKYSGGGIVIMQLALTDLIGVPFEQFMKTTVLDPLGMTNSTYQQPLPDSYAAHAAHAHNSDGHASDVPWHVYPEQAAAGLWTTPSDLARVAIELQLALRGPSGTVLKEATAREMIAPVSAGPFAVGFSITKKGEAWYFTYSGGNWGFSCDLSAHVRKGYGVVVMTNGDQGGKVIEEIESRVAAAYN